MFNYNFRSIMKNNILIFGLLLALFTGCSESFLEENPKNFLSPDNFFTSVDDAVVAVNGVYGSVGTGASWGIYDVNMLIADGGTSVQGTRVTGETHAGIATYISTPTTKSIKEIYQYSYIAIQRANLVINRVEQMDPIGTGIPKSMKNRIIGEAKFLRALCYFNLVRYYGGVPLMTEEVTDMNNLFVTRNSIEEVYIQIIEDFEFAAEHLYYKGGSALEPVYEASDNGRVPKSAAYGMLAKVYLTAASYKRHSKFHDAWNTLKNINSYEWVDASQYYQLAEQNAKAVIDIASAGGNLGLLDDYAKNFIQGSENSKESLFAIQFGPDTEEGGHVGIWSAIQGNTKMPEGGYGRINPQPEFTESYIQKYVTTPYNGLDSVNTDPRFVWNIGTIKYAKTKLISHLKIKEFTFRKYRLDHIVNFTNEVNFPVLRYADVLLMYAEALNENGKPADAAAYVNMIRERARNGIQTKTVLGAPSGLDYPESNEPAAIALNFDEEQMREIIMQERKWELCYEGQSRFDEVRMGTLVEDVRELVDYANATGNANTQSYFEMVALGLGAQATTTPSSPASGITEEDRLFPIPKVETDINSNLVQNPGW
ncbi:RagB/SusD family nutrient uptake outer membrane protein [Puteibacter caeruleilacunae]|nr:RagB/SusD family nutrient uptake outer membrane protein [Puteibacter caeruleilacunae]